jgi:hypothetical protein
LASEINKEEYDIGFRAKAIKEEYDIGFRAKAIKVDIPRLDGQLVKIMEKHNFTIIDMFHSIAVR